MPTLMESDLNGIGDLVGNNVAGRLAEFGWKPSQDQINALTHRDPRLALESLPTPWAAAEIALRRLENAGQEKEFLEEWGALLLLIYQGAVALESFDGEAIAAIDPELHPALLKTQGTPIDAGRALVLVTTADGRVALGALHPEALVFPARDRVGWSAYADELRLKNGRLSLSALLEGRDDAVRADFLQFLSDVQQGLRDAGGSASKAVLGLSKLPDIVMSRVNVQLPAATKPFNLTSDRYAWTQRRLGWQITTAANPETVVLQNYPLVYKREGNVLVVFTVAGLDKTLNPWVLRSISPNAPIAIDQIRRVDDTTVDVAGKHLSLTPDKARGIAFGDVARIEVCDLSECLLKEHWVPGPKSKGADFDTPPACFPGLRRPIVPMRRSFFQHVPLSDLAADGIRFQADEEDGVERWELRLPKKPSMPVAWRSRGTQRAFLDEDLVEIWPPKLSRAWRTYFVRVVRAGDSAEWTALTKNGGLGCAGEAPKRVFFTDATTREFVQILDEAPELLSVTDSCNVEWGILPMGLPQTTAQPGAARTVAVDFGTSNTCVAWIQDGASKPLHFSLGCLPVWGIRDANDVPGWFSHHWSEEPTPEFFPTILWHLESLALSKDVDFIEALPQLDLPGLRRGAFRAGGNGWRPAPNLKWGSSMIGQSNYNPAPRRLFLTYVLMLTCAELTLGEASLASPPQRYVFTYPLAMQKDRESFASACREVVERVEALAYGASRGGQTASRVKLVSESHAAAQAKAEGNGGEAQRDVVLDLGGGTADICVMRGRKASTMDSVRLAGRRFFDVFGKTIEGKRQGCDTSLSCLAAMMFFDEAVGGDDGRREAAERDAETSAVGGAERLSGDFGLCLRDLSSQHQAVCAQKIVQVSDPARQYAAFWMRAFFKHVLAYTLVMTAADIVEEVRAAGDGAMDWQPYIHIIPAGNGWGLLPFAGISTDTLRNKVLQRVWEETLAGLRRESADNGESRGIFELLSRTQFKIEALDSAKKKTCVALGAAQTPSDSDSSAQALLSFFGLTLGVPSAPGGKVRWFDRLDAGLVGAVANHAIDVEYPIGAKEPMHPLQAALLNMCFGHVADVPAVQHVAWNGRLKRVYSDRKVFEASKDEELALSPLTVLVEQFHGDEALEEELEAGLFSGKGN